MRRISLLLLVLAVPACAHLGLGGSGRDRARTWNEAHMALTRAEFPAAAAAFQRLADEHPRSQEGRESHFYLGAMRLDPRNPEWNPEPAEAHLRSYLAADSAEPGAITRRPEAEVFLELARQLNLPPDARMAALRPDTVVRLVVVPAQQSRAQAAEIERLRKELAARDTEVRQQKEELERIRRTLTGRRQ